MTLIKGVDTLVTGTVTIVAHSYMCKNGGEVPPGQGAVGVSWRQGGEMCGPSALSHGFPISSVVEWLLDKALLERVRGGALVSSPSTFISWLL